MNSARIFLVVVCIGLFVLAGSWGRPAFGQEPSGGGKKPKDGDACKVTEGDNKGKVGKYTENATYCEGKWGGTECAQPGGGSGSRCAPPRTAPPFTKPEIAILEAYAEAIAPNANPGAVHAWEIKYKAKILRGKGGQVTVKLPTKTVTFDSSSEGLARLFKKGQTKH